MVNRCFAMWSRSVPLGKKRRIRPLVFSLLPRCQRSWAWRSKPSARLPLPIVDAQQTPCRCPASAFPQGGWRGAIQCRGGLPDRRGLQVACLAHQKIARLPFHQGDGAATTASPDRRVTFPITVATAAIDHGRAPLDAGAGRSPPAISPLPTFPASTSQVASPVSPGRVLSLNPGINRLVGNLPSAIPGETATRSGSR